MRRAWLIGTIQDCGWKIEVQESNNPDEVLLSMCDSTIRLTKAEWKELCELSYVVNFKLPPVPECLLPEPACPVCDGVGGEGEVMF